VKTLFVLAFASLVACSSATSGASDGTFPADPYVSVASDSGALRVAVRTSPSQPPPRGTCEVEMTITDPSGAPVDGLALAVVPWMPAHGHGSSVKPSVAPEGQGKYLLSDVNLFMPGTWELRTSISGTVTDHVAPSLSVP
jgi:hypothetical protein